MYSPSAGGCPLDTMGRRGAARWWPWAAFACGGVRGGGVCGDAYATRAACDAGANGTGLPWTNA